MKARGVNICILFKYIASLWIMLGCGQKIRYSKYHATKENNNISICYLE